MGNKPGTQGGGGPGNGAGSYLLSEGNDRYIRTILHIVSLRASQIVGCEQPFHGLIHLRFHCLIASQSFLNGTCSCFSSSSPVPKSLIRGINFLCRFCWPSWWPTWFWRSERCRRSRWRRRQRRGRSWSSISSTVTKRCRESSHR